MAEAVGQGGGRPTPMTERVFGPDRPPGPIMRLPTWVNVVLVLILFASCSAANDSDSFSGDAATKDDVRDACRLLGAVAEKQGLDVDSVLEGSSSWSACREGLQP
jgi:hypothetical protein